MGLVRYLRAVAGDARFAASVLHAVGADGMCWRGAAAAAFSSLLASVAPRLDDLVRSYDGAADALAAYVDGPGGMRAAQARARQVEDRAMEARRELHRLLDRAADHAARRPPPGSSADLAWTAERRALEARLDEVHGRLRAARAEAAAAGEAMEVAARRAAAGVDRAGHQGLHGADIGLLQEVAEHAAGIGGTVSAVTGVAALVAVPWCPPLAGALEAVSLVSGGVALACDTALLAAGENDKPVTQVLVDAAALATAGAGRVLLTGLRATRVQRLSAGTPDFTARAGRLVALTGPHRAGERVAGVRQMRRLRSAEPPGVLRRALGVGETTYRPVRRFAPPSLGAMARATGADAITMVRHPVQWARTQSGLAAGAWAYPAPLWDRYRLVNGAGLVGQAVGVTDLVAGAAGAGAKPFEDGVTRRVDGLVAGRPEPAPPAPRSPAKGLG